MKKVQFADLVTCLNGDQPPRVWSLLVTVFGELAQDDGARISGSLLRHLSTLIGFKPEAVRVALHRLRKDGWIESQRRGRNSDYFLTDWGLTQSREASPRIYSTCALADRAWLVMHEPGRYVPAVDMSGAWATPNVLLTSQPVAGDQVFATELNASARVPHWMSAKLGDGDVARLAHKLISALDTLAADRRLSSELNAWERAALRVLIVHEWRRIALKIPMLPDFVFQDDWPVPHCRARVAQALGELPKPDLKQLEKSLIL